MTPQSTLWRLVSIQEASSATPVELEHKLSLPMFHNSPGSKFTTGVDYFSRDSFAQAVALRQQYANLQAQSPPNDEDNDDEEDDDVSEDMDYAYGRQYPYPYAGGGYDSDNY